MTTICLIRHGETDWNESGKLQGQTDIPLNKNGREQAKMCRNYLTSFDFDVLITSPLKRARETAEIINQQLQLPFIKMSNLMERSFGDVEGMAYQERLAAFPDHTYPNQEGTDVFLKRVMSAIHTVNRRYFNKKILLITHEQVINIILSQLSDGEVGSGKTTLMNGCISNIQYRREEWHINTYNETVHLL